MSKKIKNIIFIVIAAAVIVALGAVIYSSVKNKDNSPPPQSTTDPEIQAFMDTYDEMTGNVGATGEYDPDVSEEYMKKTEAVKSELSALGDYTSEQAAVDGCVVFNGTQNLNTYLVQEFYNKTMQGESSEITVCYFESEADSLLIRRVIFDGSKYYGVVDMTRYAYSDEDYVEFEYPCCELFENSNPNGGYYYSLYLTDREGYTFDELMNLSTSMYASEWEKFLYICEYLD